MTIVRHQSKRKRLKGSPPTSRFRTPSRIRYFEENPRPVRKSLGDPTALLLTTKGQHSKADQTRPQRSELDRIYLF